MLCVVYHVNYHQAVSEEGHVLKVYCFFSGRKFGQYADHDLLKSLFQLKNKICVDPECMISRVNSKNKG